jgi:sialate O-acetylesterase
MNNMAVSKQKMYKLLALTFIMNQWLCAIATVKLPVIWRDSMILQRNVKVPIWGWAAPNERIQIEFKGKVFATTADPDGKWYTKLRAYHWGGPFEMSVKGDHNEIVLKNILIGDVFICSGQSNMERTVGNTYPEDVAVSLNYNIRQFRVEHQDADTALEDLRVFSGWKSASPATVKGFTATGYFFAQDLYAKYGVPIGIINSSYGSALAEAWMSREGLSGFPAFYTQEKNKTVQSNPMVLYNAMLAPLTRYAIKGILWYQGEFNKGRAYQYRSLFPALIADWRRKFDQGELPFIFVQLPNYDPIAIVPGESAIAELREAQAMTLSLPKTAMAVTIETNSNTDLHPKEKKPVGIRLSLAAQKLIYGEKIIAAGPIYVSSERKANIIIVSFNNTGSGLTAKGDTLKQFAIAGGDKKFVWANAIIKGNTVEVWSNEIADPVAVRYAWADNPMGANLYNAEGLPAAPFRTDDWPGLTKPK